MNLNTFPQSQILQPKTKLDGQLGIQQNHVLPFCLEQELCSTATCREKWSSAVAQSAFKRRALWSLEQGSWGKKPEDLQPSVCTLLLGKYLCSSYMSQRRDSFSVFFQATPSMREDWFCHPGFKLLFIQNSAQNP